MMRAKTSEGSVGVLGNSGVLDFVVAAARYCALVEPSTTPIWTRETLEECRQVLADLYADALRLPTWPVDAFGETTGGFVTEEAYEAVRQRLVGALGSYDYFLDAEEEAMKYSETPIGVSSAELLADLYQVLGNFTWVMRGGSERAMYQAVAECRYSMEERWGELLLTVLRQLHRLCLDPLFELQSGDGGGEDDR